MICFESNIYFFFPVSKFWTYALNLSPSRYFVTNDMKMENKCFSHILVGKYSVELSDGENICNIVSKLVLLIHCYC